METGGLGVLLRTHKHEMVAPRIDASFHELLLDGDGLGGGVVGDAEVGGLLGEVVEGACDIGFQPGDGEERAAGFLGLGVDEGDGEDSDEAGLTGAADGDPQLERGVEVYEGSIVEGTMVVCFFRFDVGWGLDEVGVKDGHAVDLGKHDIRDSRAIKELTVGVEFEESL